MTNSVVSSQNPTQAQRWIVGFAASAGSLLGHIAWGAVFLYAWDNGEWPPAGVNCYGGPLSWLPFIPGCTAIGAPGSIRFYTAIAFHFLFLLFPLAILLPIWFRTRKSPVRRVALTVFESFIFVLGLIGGIPMLLLALQVTFDSIFRCAIKVGKLDIEAKWCVPTAKFFQLPAVVLRWVVPLATWWIFISHAIILGVVAQVIYNRPDPTPEEDAETPEEDAEVRQRLVARVSTRVPSAPVPVQALVKPSPATLVRRAAPGKLRF